jgi:hypothetical protein
MDQLTSGGMPPGDKPEADKPKKPKKGGKLTPAGEPVSGAPSEAGDPALAKKASAMELGSSAVKDLAKYCSEGQSLLIRLAGTSYPKAQLQQITQVLSNMSDQAKSLQIQIGKQCNSERVYTPLIEVQDFMRCLICTIS